MSKACWILMLGVCCITSLLLAGCGEASANDGAASETTTTVVVVTTTSAATSWTLDPGAPEPVGSAALVGSWGRVDDGYDIVITFESDGTFWWNCMAISPHDPPGDGVSGTWRANDTTVWVYGIGMAEWSCSYTIEDGVLRMQDPGVGDRLVYRWR